MKRIIRISLFFLRISLAYILSLVIKLFNKNVRNIWIIAERGDDGRDNGFFFYKYMRKVHPEQRIIYVIKDSSADADKVKDLGEHVETNSFKHFIYYALARVRISSSMWGGDLPDTDYFKKLRNIFPMKKPFVFLKHGIIKDYLPQHCADTGGNPDIYICGAKPEYDYVKRNFGHPENVVRYTGLARFDNLHGKGTKSQILIMPTFRKWLQGMSKEEVAASEYVDTWNKLLNDARIADILDKQNLELIFYPHYVMQKHIDDFSTQCDRIKIARFADYDVQTLLIESKLLVTDYSSVFFDFAYMDKPIIYYHFDRDAYIKGHYDFTKGYFSYDDNGFGDVVFNHEELVNSILKLINNQFEMEEKYVMRLQEFFPLKDKHNCERIYNEIINVL